MEQCVGVRTVRVFRSPVIGKPALRVTDVLHQNDLCVRRQHPQHTVVAIPLACDGLQQSVARGWHQQSAQEQCIGLATDVERRPAFRPRHCIRCSALQARADEAR